MAQPDTVKTGEQLSSGSSLETSRAQDSGDLDQSSDSLNQDCRAADPAEEEVLSVIFQSKYINLFPLYQDYCEQAERDDLHRQNTGFVCELSIPQDLQSAFTYDCISEDRCVELNSVCATLCSAPPPPVRGASYTLWQDLEEVTASGLLRRLSRREIHLQELMFELIGSEMSYLKSLDVAVSHFYASKELKQTLTPMEHHILFSNIRHMMAASEKFLMDLESPLEESVLISQVEDTVLQHCPEFHRIYVPYVTNMMYQETMVNQLLQQNRDFLYSMKKLESHPVCQRQSLKSFLVLPFQRIARIKLILESILKQTKPGSDSISNLERAIEAIHEILAECEREVRKMKQIEELVSLDRLLDFGKMKSVPLVVRGRFLVHQGPMRQKTVGTSYISRESLISVYLHLFNDLLIISSKKYWFRHPGFTVMDHAEFPTHVTVEHVQTEVLGLPPDSFLLNLSKSHTGQPISMILSANTRSDKEAWMKLLPSKQ